jgi:hypothetical protein
LEPLAAGNFLTLSSFVLSGFFGFLLLLEISENFWVAIFAGLYLSLLPGRWVHFYHALSLARIQWLILYLFFLLKLLRQPEKTHWFWGVSVALALVILNDFYYGFFTIIFSVFLLWPTSLLPCFTARENLLIL